MKERIEQLRLKIDALSLRERGILFLAIIAVLYLLLSTALFGPLEARQKIALDRIASLQKEISTYDNQTQDILRRHSFDPNADNRRLQQQMHGQIGALDEQIASTVHGLIAPQQMAKALEDVLKRQGKLRLLHIESLPAKPLLEPAADDKEASANPAGIYKHGVRLEFSGDYLSALQYLHELQALPWVLYWDDLQITMDKYPAAHITIVVHTLSLNEGWIGV